MPSWVADLLQTDRLLTVALVVFLAWLVIKSTLNAWPFLAGFVTLVQTLVGDDENPGIGHRMEAQGTKLSELTELIRGQGDELEKVRAQVQNSHKSNLRDDMDTVKVAVDEVAEAVKHVTDKLDEHIDIAKKYDAAQDETARQVEKLVAKWADGN